MIPFIHSNLPNLEKLTIEDTKIEYIPENIDSLNRLKHLILKRNSELNGLKNGVTKLTHLESLKISNSHKLVSLPQDLGKLSELTELVVNFCNLNSLPDSIGDLRKLTGLHLLNNNLPNVPESIGNLRRLRRLRVLSNPLSEETETWLNHVFPRVVEYNRASHDQVLDYQDVVNQLYHEDAAKEIYKCINDCSAVKVAQLNDEKPIPGDRILKEFLSKTPLKERDPLGKVIYSTTIKVLLQEIVNADKKEDIQNYLSMLLVTLGDCGTPIKEFLEQKSVAFFKNKPEFLVYLHYQALDKHARQKLGKALNKNEGVEFLKGLMNIIFLKGAEEYQKNMFKVVGIRLRRPSPTNYPEFAFEQTALHKEVTIMFLKLVCKTDVHGELIVTPEEKFILDPVKMTRIYEPFLANLGMESKRENLIAKYSTAIDMMINTYPDLKALHSREEKVAPLLNIPKQKQELREALILTRDQDIKNVYQEQLQETIDQIKAVAENFKCHPRLSSLTKPLNEQPANIAGTKRNNSVSPNQTSRKVTPR